MSSLKRNIWRCILVWTYQWKLPKNHYQQWDHSYLIGVKVVQVFVLNHIWRVPVFSHCLDCLRFVVYCRCREVQLGIVHIGITAPTYVPPLNGPSQVMLLRKRRVFQILGIKRSVGGPQMGLGVFERGEQELCSPSYWVGKSPFFSGCTPSFCWFCTHFSKGGGNDGLHPFLCRPPFS